MSRAAPGAKATTKELWRQFLPLSLTDITMALCDPLISLTLAHLPNSRASLAATGVAKSQAVFFESPIIMLLHASNALAPSRASRRALFKFTAMLTALLTLLMAILVWPPLFHHVGTQWLGLDTQLLEETRLALSLLLLWPAAIGWRRYYQGLLIHHGRGTDVGRASLSRAALLTTFLGVGYVAGIPGTLLASAALMLGVLCELAFVLRAAHNHGLIDRASSASASDANQEQAEEQVTFHRIFRFYWPLANSMLVVWGGRALLIGLVGQAIDSGVSLAAWPAAWGLVLLVANSTRMVQQVTIRNRHHTPTPRLLSFTLSVGALGSMILLLLGLGPLGQSAMRLFLGGDESLASAALPVLRICVLVPLMVALQNTTQGFLIGDGRTQRVNAATWIGTSALLSVAWWLLHRGWPGATAAALAMTTAIAIEVLCLITGYMSHLHAWQIHTLSICSARLQQRRFRWQR